MQITLLVVGKLRESYWRDAVEEYLKRLRPYARCSVIEVPDEPTPDKAPEAVEEEIREREGRRILSHIKERDFVIALAISGKMYSSDSFAEWLEDLVNAGQSQWAFVIGGSLGLHKDVLARADATLSFSRFTFPHQMVRVILLEQIYRSFKIRRREPYHK